MPSPRSPARVPRSLRRALERRLARAARRLGLPAGVTADLHLVDDRAMIRLNRAHRGARGPTDVLSFPTCPEGSEVPEALAALGPGDVVLDVDAIARAAGHDPRAWLDEAAALAVHGLAHLVGHDHGDRRAGRAMHRAELRALAAARTPDIPRPYGLRPRRRAR